MNYKTKSYETKKKLAKTLKKLMQGKNFKNISISFKGFPSNLKNGIKNMYLDIEID